MFKKFFATSAIALLMLAPISALAQTTGIAEEPQAAYTNVTGEQVDFGSFGQEAPFGTAGMLRDEDRGISSKTIGAVMASLVGILMIVAIPFIGVLVYLLIAFIKIAQKTHTPNGWLVITLFAIPFKIAKFAGLSYWFGLIAFASLPFYLIDERLASVVALGVTGFFTYLWMRVCKRLGFSQWLGLLMIVPIANLVLPGVLAFSKNQLVENTQF